MSTYRSYILCTSPRSGSTLLCKLLSATGVAGHPGSHFHEPSLEAWLAYFGLPVVAGEAEPVTLRRVFAAAIHKGRNGTDLYGLRLQRHSFDFFMKKLAVLFSGSATDLERLDKAFGKTLFIHLTRQDKVEQAVSYVKAEQSGLWHKAPDGTELERLSEPKEPEYDFKAIEASYDRFIAFDRDWLTWFEHQRIQPLRITYEDLSAHPQRELARVLTRLGLDAEKAAGVTPGVAKLADAVSAEWADRFRQTLDEAENSAQPATSS